jgi:hypothetical protein
MTFSRAHRQNLLSNKERDFKQDLPVFDSRNH